VGCSITHQTMNATTAQPAMVFRFTSPPTGARLPRLAREPMLACADFAANANGVKLPCRHEYAPCGPQYARSAEAVRDRACRPRRPYSQIPSFAALIGDFAVTTGSHLTAFLRAELAGEMTVPDAGETDFAVIVYPGYLALAEQNFAPNAEIQVTEKTPPTFLVQAEDDPVHVENSTLYFLALKNARVPAEMHLYASGGHGYGLRRTELPVTAWPKLVETWLETIQVLPTRKN